MEHQLFEVIESISALREFARVYTIDGLEGMMLEVF